VTTSKPYPSPRALSLAASIAWRHVTSDPVRALLLAWRVLPGPVRPWLRLAGPYGRAAALWGTGERHAALTAAGPSPRRLAAFSLAVDQPAVAADAVASAIPSMSPRTAGPAPSIRVRKSGSRG